MLSIRTIASLTLGAAMMFESWGYMMPHQDPTDTLILVIDVLQHLDKKHIRTGGRDHPMKVVIHRAEVLVILRCTQHRSRILQNRPKLLAIHEFHIMLDDERLQQLPGLKGLIDNRNRQRLHQHPLLRDDLDEALLLELAERLAHRRPRNIDLLHHLRLVDKRIRRVAAVQNLLLYE